MHRARVFILTHRVVFRYQLSSVTAQNRAQKSFMVYTSDVQPPIFEVLKTWNASPKRPLLHYMRSCKIFCVPDFGWFQNSNTSYLQNLVKGSRQPTGCFFYFLAEQTKLGLNFWKERRWSNFLKGMYPKEIDTLWYFQLFGWSKMVHDFFTPKLDVKPLPRPECLHRGSSHPGEPPAGPAGQPSIQRPFPPSQQVIAWLWDWWLEETEDRRLPQYSQGSKS